MVSKHLMEIVIKAIDQTKDVAQKVENNFKRIGTSATSSMEATSQATNKVASSFDKINQVTNVSRGYFQNMSFTAKSSFATLSNAQKRALLDLSNLNQKCVSTREELSTIGTTGYNAFLQLSVSSKTALTNWDSMSQSALKWSDHIKLAQNYTKGFGVDIDSIKGRVLVLGNALQSELGSKFETIKTKVTGVAGVIKSGLSSALTTVKSKVDTVANSFTGLGGVISGAIGAIGMSSITELTVGLAMTRERMTTLTAATWGSAKAAKEFVGYMDEMTNNSLVSLNDLGQAMNTIKMSTGMSNKELKNFTSVVNDIGQRAILMGKDTTEAMSLMQSAGRGLNGEFEILKSNFGITKEQLQKLGWKGTAKDVEGYQKALEKALAAGGDMDGMMNTLSGQIQLVKKGFTSAGRQIGEMFVPYIKEAVTFMVGMKQECPEVYKYIIGIAGAVSGFATIAPTLSPILTTMSLLSSGLGSTFTTISALAGSTGSAMKILSSGFQEVYNAEKGVYEMQCVMGPATKAFYTALASGEGILSAIKAGYAEMAIAEYISLGPLLLIIGAIIALGVAVYEVGKYFGWWSDLPSMLGAISTGLQRLWTAFVNNPDVQATVEAISEAFEWLCDVLSPVTEAVASLFPESTTEEFDIVRVIIDTLGYSFHQLALAVGYVGGCISNTISFFEWLYTSIVNLPTAVYNMIIAFSTWLAQLPIIVFNYLVMVTTSIITAGNNWVTNSINIAYKMVYGVIKWISQLPSRVYNYIVSVASRILAGGSKWISNARSLAVSTVSAVINQIANLPQKVYNEFIQIGSRIRNAVSSAVSAASSFGSNIKNAVLNALHIHSPGIVQLKIATEFENTIGQIKDRVSSAKDKAKEFGKGIVDGFSSQDVSSNLIISPTMDYDTSSLQPLSDVVSTPVNTLTSADNTENPIVDTLTNTSDTTSTSLTEIVNTNKTAFDTMLLNEKMSMSQMTNDVGLNLDTISLNENTKLNQMTDHINTSMNNILDKTKSGLTQTTKTTKSNLSKMQTSTSKVTNNMVKAWGSMKTNIVKSAKDIQSQSTSYFNTLQKTISSFYNRLQHPGGAGHGSYSPVKSSPKFSSPFGRVNSSLASKIFNIDIDYLGDNTTASNLKGVDLGEILKGCSEGNCGAGSWSDVVKPNVSKIKNTARNWNMKGPVVAGRYSTGLRFKVKEFENGVPKISFSTFKGMAEDVFSKCHYEFYYDSNKYGNWVRAFLGGGMNCSDSSDALIWMANACGLPASKVHGHWNQFGHYWANVAGHKMDTTGWMQRRTWTPSASHAGSPSDSPFSSLTKAIDNLATDTTTGEDFDVFTGETVSKEVTVNGELKVIHEFKNLPKGVTAEEVARIVNETTSSDDWQKTLANSVTFQSEDDKVKTRLKRKLTRAKGAR